MRMHREMQERAKQQLEYRRRLELQKCKRNKDFRKKFESLLFNSEASDVNITCNDGSVLPAHKFILCSRSEVFAAMFRNGLKETITNNINILDFDVDTVKGLLSFLYTNKLKNTITFDEGMELIRMASQYDINGVLKDVEESLVKQLNAKLVVDLPSTVTLLKDADTYGLEVVKSACLYFLIYRCELDVPSKPDESDTDSNSNDDNDGCCSDSDLEYTKSSYDHKRIVLEPSNTAVGPADDSSEVWQCASRSISAAIKNVPARVRGYCNNTGNATDDDGEDEDDDEDEENSGQQAAKQAAKRQKVDNTSATAAVNITSVVFHATADGGLNATEVDSQENEEVVMQEIESKSKHEELYDLMGKRLYFEMINRALKMCRR